MSKGKSIKISAVVITYNEEGNIGRCIDSLKKVADEIIVVDCFSQDRTKQICLEKGVAFFENEFLGFAHQKNFAASLANYEYVLSLDADEYLSPELTQATLKVKNNCEYDGYSMNRLSSYEGEWIKTCGWYPDSKLRLWKKEQGAWKGQGIHEWLELGKQTRVKHLKGDLHHHAYDNITQFLEKIQRYSDIYAMENRFKIYASGFKVLYKSVFAFIKSFLIKRGIADGYKGLLISVCNANFVFYKYSKLREANRQVKTSLIVSTYNREDALELTLISVMNQSILPDEVIIADDGSRQATKELIDRYKSIFPVPLVHCWHEDTGFRAGQIRNKAIAMSRFEYIISIDGDMILHEHFVSAHKKAVWKGRFIQGSRVLLSSKKTEEAIEKKKIRFLTMESGLTNKLNSVFSPVLSSLISGTSTKLEGTKTCNMAFWKSDFLQINGFNEDIVGWGREDTEMAVRLLNIGVKRFNLKFGGFGYHLYHRENSRAYLLKNDQILQHTIETKQTHCPNGISKYMVDSPEIRPVYYPPLELVN